MSIIYIYDTHAIGWPPLYSDGVYLIYINIYIHPSAFGVSCNLNLQSQSPWSLFSGTGQRRPRKLYHRLRFENEEMTLQM